MTHIQSILGVHYNPDYEYLIIFPSSLPVKARLGWKLVLENAGELLGETFLLVGRPKTPPASL